MSATWHIQKNNQTIGPLSAQQLRELALVGKLRPVDLVRKGDEGQFTAASGIKNLFSEDQVVSRLVPPPPRLPSSAASSLGAGSPQLDLQEPDLTVEPQRLRQQIETRESVSIQSVLTPKRLLVGSGAVACIFMLLAMVSVGRNTTRLDVSQHFIDGRQPSSRTKSSTSNDTASAPEFFSEPYTHVTMDVASSSKVHEILLSEFDDGTTGPPKGVMPIKDVSEVSFAIGKNGEPIELFIVRTDDGKLDQEAHFYTDTLTGKSVFHGTLWTYHKNGNPAGCYLYVWGQLKCFSKWKSNGSPTQFEIYLGDEDHRRYSFFYFDSSPSGPYTLSSMESQRCTHIQGEEGHEVHRRCSDGLRVELDEDGDVWRKSIWRNSSDDNRVKDGICTGLTVIRKNINNVYTQGSTVSHDSRDQMVLDAVLDEIRRLRDEHRQ